MIEIVMLWELVKKSLSNRFSSQRSTYKIRVEYHDIRMASVLNFRSTL